MRIFHIALQGCLKSGPIDYGITGDTGGHIRYLLDLVDALAVREEVTHQVLITRRFEDESLGAVYAERHEKMAPGVDLYRIDGLTADYISKEELYRENDTLGANLVRLIGETGLTPDIIHAHYADAGKVGAIAGQEFGVPVMFTGHSLGRVKRDTLIEAQGHITDRQAAILQPRIAVEEEAIAAADLIIASSRDEAEGQYGLYQARPERIRINPPGCDLSAFGVTDDTPMREELRADIDRFLDDPSKPPVLALARPVRKKNLHGLIEAYGQSTALQEAANLVIFAGVRDDIEDLEPENADVMRELLYLMDKYDLYGRCALPKQHEPGDVPSMYRYVRQNKGVFVNAAYNEPFGLTFIEAAASGVPVVATNQGGPNDILEICQNGVLVDPLDTDAIAKAALKILEDPAFWQRCSTGGATNVAHYSWARHAEQYVADCRSLLSEPAVTPRAFTAKMPYILISDIDNTLTGDKAALAGLGTWLNQHAAMQFGIATGRSLHSALDILRAENAPIPEVLITSVGSEIYYLQDDNYFVSADDDWLQHIAEGWDRDRLEALIAPFDTILPQGHTEQRAFKLSYFTHNAQGEVEQVRRLIETEGLAATVIYSHGRYMDVLPVRASKGAALRHVAEKLTLPLDATVAAGDSGNDVELLTAAGYGIIVGNRSEELAGLAAQNPHIYEATAHHAAGIIEGLERSSDVFPPRLGQKSLIA